MRKLIDIPEEIEIDLKILAVKSGKDLKNYIQDILIDTVKLNKPFFCDGYLVNGETTCIKQCDGCKKCLYTHSNS